MRKFMVKSILWMLVICSFFVWGFWYLKVVPYLNEPLDSNVEYFYYDFKKGSNVTSVADDLHDLGLLKKPSYLKYYAKIMDKTRNLKAGTYRIEPSEDSPLAILDRLEEGGIAEYKVRLREGDTFKKMLSRLFKIKKLKHKISELDPDLVMIEINHPGEIYEGAFYPGTYSLAYGMSDIDLLRMAFKKMQIILEHEWENRGENLYIKNAQEGLILASIIEKETANKAEKNVISGVFHNRLRKKMRLQTDPTVIYGMGDRYKGNIARKDLRERTRFNTYVISGLPPTPICMPSRDSIKAAFHPAKTDALFFVAKGGGVHYFSATYKEHKKAVFKYQIEPYRKRQKAKKIAEEKRIAEKNRILKEQRLLEEQNKIEESTEESESDAENTANDELDLLLNDE